MTGIACTAPNASAPAMQAVALVRGYSRSDTYENKLERLYRIQQMLEQIKAEGAEETIPDNPNLSNPALTARILIDFAHQVRSGA